MELLSLRLDPLGAAHHALRSLRKGKVLIFATDTVYGIGGDALNASVVRRVRRLKGRAKTKSFPWLVSDIAMAKRYGIFSSDTERFARNVWPGPVTLVVRRRRGRGTLALRVPDHTWLRRLIRFFGRPIVGTSANQSGKDPARTARSAARIFPGVEVVIDGGTLKKRPSRIVDCTQNKYRVIRE